QGDELAQQNEELAEQAEELTQQGEELARQNEELQSQAEEIAHLMETVERRNALLQTLMDTARSSGSEESALDQIARAGSDLFGTFVSAIAVFEQTTDGLCVRALAPHPSRSDDGVVSGDDLVALVLDRGRTAALVDVAA